MTKSDLSASERKIVWTDRGVDYISPEKMFGLLKSSIDRVLTGLDLKFVYQGQTYRVTRHEFAPVTLVCSGPGIFFEVDFVPSFKFDFRLEKHEILDRHCIIYIPDLSRRKYLRGLLASPTSTTCLLRTPTSWPSLFTEPTRRSLSWISTTWSEIFSTTAAV